MSSSKALTFLKSPLVFGGIAGALWVLLVYAKKELRLEFMRDDDLFIFWLPLTHALSVVCMVVMVHLASRWYNRVIRFGRSIGLTATFSGVAYVVFIGGVFALDIGPSSLSRALEDTLFVVLAIFLACALIVSLFAKKLSRNPMPSTRSEDILDEDLL